MSSRNCSIDGCGKNRVSKGLCPAHLRRLNLYGDPLKLSDGYRKCEIWIDSHKDYKLDDCIEWPFGKSSNGRGVLSRGRGGFRSAPKAMCIAAHGLPPHEKAETAHSCGNGHLGCMNPNHMRWATHMENVKDRADHGRDRKGVEINTAKLDDLKVLEIRSLAGMKTGKMLAKDYGVSPSTISDIIKRKSWKWL